MEERPATLEKLREEMDALAGEVAGTVAYCVIHPASGARVERNATARFVAASVIKVPILMECFRQATHEGLDFNEVIPLKDGVKVGGSGVLKVLHEGLNVTISDLAMLMTVVSDNTATNILLERIGVEKVNAFLKERGCTVTECRRKLYDWEAMKQGIHNHIAAGEIADLLAAAAAGRLISPQSDADMLTVMKKQQYREKIPHLLPKGAVTANKTGSLDEVSHDCGVVTLPNGDWFALALLSGDLKGCEDGPGRDAVNATLARMSLACYRYAEAHPPDGYLTTEDAG